MAAKRMPNDIYSIQAEICSQFVKNRMRMHRSTRPPSNGYTGSRLNMACTPAHTAMLGKGRKRRRSSKLPMGPASALRSSFSGGKGSITICIPHIPTRIPSIFPFRIRIIAIWHTSWNITASSHPRNQFSGSVSSTRESRINTPLSKWSKSVLRQNGSIEI